MDFLNRKNEIQKIKRLTDSADPSFIVIYGRRRCGKSRLLKQIIEPGDIYFQADLNHRNLQLSSLANEIEKNYHGFGKMIYPGWEGLLANLNKFVPAGKKLILDEFPYLVKNSPELPSVLQRWIDSRQLSFHCIACGSSQQMMHDIVMRKNEPLYGRASLILKVKESDLPQFLGQVWEELARKSVPHQTIEGMHWNMARKWWGTGKNGQVMELDIVAESEDKKSLLFAEVKWSDHDNPCSVVESAS